MRIAVIFLAVLATVAAIDLKKKPLIPAKFADSILLQNQKFLLDILSHIHEPLNIPEYEKYTSSWVQGKANYTDYDSILELIEYTESGLLPRNEIFSVFNKNHLQQAISVFNLLYLSSNWETFYQNAIWARQNVNEGMFVYALTLSIAHRSDTAGLELPAPYEIFPYLFFDGQAVNDAQNWRTKATLLKPGIYSINASYSSNYYLINEDAKLAYFTEDIGWNSYYYNYHIDYPFWMNGTVYGLKKDRRGELFLYMHQQIIARYNLERLSNRLGELEELSLTGPVKSGYDPHMRFYNGVPFSLRRNNFDVSALEDYQSLELIDDYERRVRDAIDYGYYTTRDGQKINLREPNNIEVIGNIIEANPDSIDSRFFGYWNLLAHLIFGGAHWDISGTYKVIPSVLENFETTLRDPIFYQLYNRMLKNYNKFQHFLMPYKYEDLLAPNLNITKVTVGKLVTFFDYFYADITNVVDSSTIPTTTSASTPPGMITPVISTTKPSAVFKVLARQARLNHKPFGIAIEVNSTAAQTIVVRTYLGPKYDQYGKEYTLNEIRKNLLEIDQFQYDLPFGKATIVRLSKNFYWSVKDRTTYKELYKKVMLAISGSIPLLPIDMSEAQCGFPDRLLLPKGWVSGLPMQLFIVITPYKAPAVPQYSTYDHLISCGIGSGSRYIDDLPFGFPYEREISNSTEFSVPNIYNKDVLIYHKQDDLIQVPVFE